MFISIVISTFIKNNYLEYLAIDKYIIRLSLAQIPNVLGFLGAIIYLMF